MLTYILKSISTRTHFNTMEQNTIINVKETIEHLRNYDEDYAFLMQIWLGEERTKQIFANCNMSLVNETETVTTSLGDTSNLQ